MGSGPAFRRPKKNEKLISASLGLNGNTISTTATMADDEGLLSRPCLPRSPAGPGIGKKTIM
jgi:hypothetical protein